MPDDSGDLRDRFRRTDYRSTPLRPRPSGPVREVVPISSPARPNPESQDETARVINAPKAENAPARKTEAAPQLEKIPSSVPSLPVRPQILQERSVVVPPPRKIFTNEAAADTLIPPLETFNTPAKAKSSRRLRKRAAAKTGKTKSKAKKWLVIAPLILFVLSGAGLVAWHYFQKKTDLNVVIPPQYTSASVGFQLYYPKNLPYGYRVGPRSFSFGNGALIFYIDTGDGKTIPVSEQAVPDGKTAADLVPSPPGVKVTDIQAIAFDGGTSALSKWDSKTITSTVADKTWIILNVTSVSNDNAKAVTQAFKKLQE